MRDNKTKKIFFFFCFKYFWVAWECLVTFWHRIVRSHDVFLYWYYINITWVIFLSFLGRYLYQLQRLIVLVFSVQYLYLVCVIFIIISIILRTMLNNNVESGYLWFVSVINSPIIIYSTFVEWLKSLWAMEMQMWPRWTKYIRKFWGETGRSKGVIKEIG